MNLTKEKKTYFDVVKKLIYKVFSSRNIKLEELETIIKEYSIDYNIVPKLMTLFLSYPDIFIHINKTLNNKYITSCSLEEILYSFNQIFKRKNIRPEDLFFLKYDSARIKKIKIIKDFLEKQLIDLNLSEINFLINLSDVIEEDISEEKEKESIKLNKLDILKFDWKRELSNQIKSLKTKREKCRECPLFLKPIVTFDTNASYGENVDVVFIGLNPGKQEVKKDVPLIGRAGSFFRSYLETLSGIKWLLTNVILCHTTDEKEMKTLGDPVEIANNCNEMVLEILEKFNPKLYVTLGKVSTAIFGDKSFKNGELFEKDGRKIFPMLHPSAAIHYGRKKEDFEREFQKLRELVKLIDDTEEKTTHDSQLNGEITEIHSTREEQKLTLFDISELDNETVLVIFIDEEGNKIYKKWPLKLDIYLNSDSWKNQTTIVDKQMKKFNINSAEKGLIIKYLREQKI